MAKLRGSNDIFDDIEVELDDLELSRNDDSAWLEMWGMRDVKNDDNLIHSSDQETPSVPVVPFSFRLSDINTLIKSEETQQIQQVENRFKRNLFLNTYINQDIERKYITQCGHGTNLGPRLKVYLLLGFFLVLSSLYEAIWLISRGYTPPHVTIAASLYFSLSMLWAFVVFNSIFLTAKRYPRIVKAMHRCYIAALFDFIWKRLEILSNSIAVVMAVLIISWVKDIVTNRMPQVCADEIDSGIVDLQMSNDQSECLELKYFIEGGYLGWYACIVPMIQIQGVHFKVANFYISTCFSLTGGLYAMSYCKYDKQGLSLCQITMVHIAFTVTFYYTDTLRRTLFEKQMALTSSKVVQGSNDAVGTTNEGNAFRTCQSTSNPPAAKPIADGERPPKIPPYLRECTDECPVVGVDNSGLVFLWNAKMEEATGLKTRDIVGRAFLRDLVVSTEDDPPALPTAGVSVIQSSGTADGGIAGMPSLEHCVAESLTTPAKVDAEKLVASGGLADQKRKRVAFRTVRLGELAHMELIRVNGLLKNLGAYCGADPSVIDEPRTALTSEALLRGDVFICFDLSTELSVVEAAQKERDIQSMIMHETRNHLGIGISIIESCLDEHGAENQKRAAADTNSLSSHADQRAKCPDQRERTSDQLPHSDSEWSDCAMTDVSSDNATHRGGDAMHGGDGCHRSGRASAAGDNIGAHSRVTSAMNSQSDASTNTHSLTNSQTDRKPAHATEATDVLGHRRDGESSLPHDKVSRDEQRAADMTAVLKALVLTFDATNSLQDLDKMTRLGVSLKTEPVDVVADLLQPLSTMFSSSITKELRFVVETSVPVKPQSRMARVEGDGNDSSAFAESDFIAPSNLDAVVACGHRLKMLQVLVNLCTNSFKFAKRGYVRVCLAPAPPGRVAIEVHDTGPGITNEASEYVFEKFSTIYHDESSVHGGGSSRTSRSVASTDAGRNAIRTTDMGLGLYLCSRLAGAMGGSVTHMRHWRPPESDFGDVRGCSMRFELPAWNMGAHCREGGVEDAAGGPHRQDAVTGRPERLPVATSNESEDTALWSRMRSVRLLGDDDGSFAHGYVRALVVSSCGAKTEAGVKTVAGILEAKSCGWHVTSVFDGEAAIVIVATGAWDVVCIVGSSEERSDVTGQRHDGTNSFSDHQVASTSGGSITDLDQTVGQERPSNGGELSIEEIVQGIRNVGFTGCVVTLGGLSMSAARLEEAGADLMLSSANKLFQRDARLQVHSVICHRFGLPIRWRVLIVDDMAASRRVVQAKLRSLGVFSTSWSFVEASSGSDAMSVVRQGKKMDGGMEVQGRSRRQRQRQRQQQCDQVMGERGYFDLAIVDQHLGDGISGRQVATELRRRCPNAIIVSYSADVDTLTAATSMLPGGDKGLLGCPVDRGAAGADGGAGHSNGNCNGESHKVFDLQWSKPLPSNQRILEDLRIISFHSQRAILEKQSSEWTDEHVL